MPFEFTDLLQAVYKELGVMNITTLTGGSTTTAIDTKLVNVGKDDDWKDGAVFAIRDSAGASAAPEGEFQRISAWDTSAGQFTVDTAFSAALASGDTVGYVSSQYPLYAVKELVNDGLRSLGDLVLIDTTTLDTEADKTEYTASLAWKRRRPLAIDMQTDTDDADDNRWVRIYGWRWIPAAPGTTGLIVFNESLTASRDLRIWYLDRHPTLVAYNDDVAETIHPELATAAGVEKVLRWQVSRLQGQDDFLIQRWNEQKVELDRLKQSMPPYMPVSTEEIFVLQGAGNSHYTGTPLKVRL